MVAEPEDPADGRTHLDPLSVRLVGRGVVYPTIRVASRPGKLLMGVYDEYDRYVDDTVLDRRAGEQGDPVPRELFPAVVDSPAPAAIYAGPLYFHFGHFLLESLARCWYAQQHPDLPLVWAGQHDWQGVPLRPWQSEILDILGIGNAATVVADPTRFEVLHVPDIGYRYDDRFHPDHARFLGRYQGPAQVPGARLWVSRSKISSDARDLNAEVTERRLREAGWAVAYPETLTVREQLDAMARAETVAGEEGSAFHAAMLLEDVAGKKLHILRRYGREHANMQTVGRVRGLDQTFHTLERERVLRAEGRFVSKMTPNSSEVLDLLDVPVGAIGAVNPDDAPMQRTVAQLEPRRLLDVGSSTPHLILGSRAEVRVAVSPLFDFDPRSFPGCPVEFYELGLKHYADLFHEGRARFDVIRITGRDHEGLMEAFRVSKRLADPTTTWVFGSDPVSARTVLAIRLTHAGFSVRRLLVGRTTIFVVRRVPGEPTNAAGVGRLSRTEVQRRLRRVRPASLRQLRRRILRGRTVRDPED